MKRRIGPLLVCPFLILLLLTIHLPVVIVKAENKFMEPAPYEEVGLYLSKSVSVERRIEFLSGGYVMINDTFSLSIANVTGMMVGIPRNYSGYLIYYIAYDSRGKLPIKLVEGDEGFQWFEINFIEPIALSNETYTFTITYVFFGLIKSVDKNKFYVIFPLYPSLREDALLCNVTIALPPGVSVSEAKYPSGVFLNETDNLLRNSTSPLVAYANTSSWVMFTSSTFKLLRFLEIIREITVDAWGKITVNDLYEMSIANVNEITLNLPAGASHISVYDAYGIYQKGQVRIKHKNDSVVVEIVLSEKLKESNRVRVSLSYDLPFWTYITKYGWQHYALNINLTKPDEWIIHKIAVTIILPEGANFLLEDQYSKLKIEREGLFQEKATLNYYNVTKFEGLGVLSVRYQYALFWTAFRPVLLFGTLIGLISLIFILFKSSSRVETVTPALIPPEKLKEFIETFEERNNILSEIESLEQQSKRGKIPMRQYKLMKKSLDERLSLVQGKLVSLKSEIEIAGGRYADMLRRLEMASAEIETVKRSITDVELRYRRGEISSEIRRNLLEEYESRRKRAENIIEEVLLRFREEIL